MAPRTQKTSSRAKAKRKPREPQQLDDPHLARARAYIAGVLSGEIPACRFVRAACQRQRDDLARFAESPLFYFDENLASRVCRFVECLPHVKGPKANTKITLEPWQCFILTTVFGWRRRDTGGRRFRRVYIEVPRGNAKSTLSSAVALYCLGSDGEEGAEVYSAATTREQARIVFGDAQAMLRKAPQFAAKLGIVVNQHACLLPAANGKFAPLSREAGNLDGLNVHCAIVDELHAHRTREIYDVIETGAGKRLSSLIWIISTAGSDTSGICYEVRSYSARVLDRTAEDESQFAVIYTIDDADDWTDPAVWRKANPNWAISVQPDAFAQLANKALQLPSAQSNFKTKHLNVWVNADQAWMDMRAWDRAADGSLNESEFAGAPCFIGLDLAAKTDLCAKVRLFYRDVPKSKAPAPDGQPVVTERHYYAFLTTYLPEQAISDGRNASYSGWALEGRIVTTPGDVLDFATVREGILDDARDFVIREVAFDPWQATQLSQELSAEGLTMVEYRPTVQNFSAPMKELDALIRAGRFHHDGNPLFRWMVSNVVCHTDAKDNIYPRKQRNENKIDGVVACISALGRAMVAIEEPAPYTAERGLRSL